MKNLIIALAALVAVGCSKEPDQQPEPEQSKVTILAREYGLEKGSYYSGYYDFMKEECLVFHIELTNPAGITVEISKELIGEKIYLEPSDEFWFFAIGNGEGGFRALENDNGDFDTYSGWFIANVNEQTNECLLEFELNRDGECISNGKISEIFERATSL